MRKEFSAVCVGLVVAVLLSGCATTERARQFDSNGFQRLEVLGTEKDVPEVLHFVVEFTLPAEAVAYWWPDGTTAQIRQGIGFLALDQTGKTHLIRLDMRAIKELGGGEVGRLIIGFYDQSKDVRTYQRSLLVRRGLTGAFEATHFPINKLFIR